MPRPQRIVGNQLLSFKNRTNIEIFTNSFQNVNQQVYLANKSIFGILFTFHENTLCYAFGHDDCATSPISLFLDTIAVSNLLLLGARPEKVSISFTFMMVTFCLYYWCSSRFQFLLQSLHFQSSQCYILQHIFFTLVSVIFSFSSNHLTSIATLIKHKYVSALSSTIIEDHFSFYVHSNCLLSYSGNLLTLH